jgi:HEAT repeat protein
MSGMVCVVAEGVRLSPASPQKALRRFACGFAQRHDESENVRLTVLHALVKIPADEALPLLDEMARDRSARVSIEAKRYAGLLRR